MSTKNLHVIFGAGPLGRSVMNALLARGQAVRMVSRTGRLEQAPPGVEIVAGDASDPQCVRALTQTARVVYQCAAPPYERWQAEFPALQAALLAGLSGSDARLVIAENLYMYGAPGGRPLVEDQPHAAHTRKGRLRAGLAQAALQAHQDGHVRVAIGRGSDFFGPWVLGSTMGARVFGPALAGKSASLMGRTDVPHTFTFIQDFGEALVVLGEHEAADGQAWHVPNDRPKITQDEFVDLIGQELGRPVKRSAMGRGMLALGGLFIPAARESIEMLYEFEQPWVVDSSKFEKAFGFQATPLPQAIAQTAAWYRTQAA